VAGLTPPVTDYHHGEDCAVVGGAVRQGAFVYADLCSGRIWKLERDAGLWRTTLIADAPFLISSIAQDAQGTIYVLDYSNGAVYTLE
jgi:hypothetical protein